MTGCCDFDVEFGFVTCDNPDHCEHPSKSGDGVDWVCDVCGDRKPMTNSGPPSGVATALGPDAAVGTCAGGSTEGRAAVSGDAPDPLDVGHGASSTDRSK